MGTIVVGFDGSDNGQAALLFAIEEAQLRSARLRVLCAWELPGEDWSEFPPLEKTLDQFREGAENIVEDATAIVNREAPDVEVEGLSVEGRPGSALLDNASDAAMIVVGTRGHGGLTGLLLGSVSQEVVRKATVPVVVVPPGESSK